MKRSKKFKLDKEAINKIDSEYDDRDLSNYTNYEVYEEEKATAQISEKARKTADNTVCSCACDKPCGAFVYRQTVVQ